ncbi:phage coat protein [Emergencia timonensis]|uniref:major capsid protein n=1 Tax=Emergencia timonensis TaxID=1776384 RepID=UPI001D0849C5|nr:major capsid protein [Emergencia timonensis]MCB6475595.1 phage coat protein [Emergencia timonensis]
MAKFDAKTFNPQAFAKYMGAVPNVRLNKLRESRAIAGDQRLRSVFRDNTQTGTTYATIPFFGLIGGEPQNYDGETDIVPTNTKTFEQGVFTYGRMNGWTEADFSYDVTGGADFMANVREQITKYWNTVDQDVLLSILKGVFSMAGSSGIAKAGKEFVAKHTYDIGSADVATTEEHLVNATTLNNAAQQACGDNKSIFTLALVHSTVATNLENLKLMSYLKYTDANGIERDLGMGTWNGRLVVIDDSMPVETKSVGATGGSQTLYTSYLLGEGAIGMEEVGAKVPYEMVRNALTRGGEDTLISRRRNALSVSGISYTKKSQATNSPSNAELEKGENWELINDGNDTISDKAIPIARIISRG